MRLIVILFFIIYSIISNAQFSKHYTVSNAHSHNDYEQARPFYAAYEVHFGSMEADIFLVDNGLLVAHEQKELSLHRTLDSMYLQPLRAAIKKNNGYPYKDSTYPLQLLIDI